MFRSKLAGINPKTPSGRRRLLLLILTSLLGLAAIAGMAVLGGVGGYRVALAESQRSLIALEEQSLGEQYSLAVEDMNAGRFDFARQRFEYVLAQDPAFSGAADGLARALAVLNATATPTPLPATSTPTPTRDLRPVEELFNQVRSHFTLAEWDKVLELVVALRQADPAFRSAQVDGMLYRALRNRGVARIIEQGDLERGIYDLSLAENFGPLDVDAQTYRDLARYYGMGSGFWEVYPEQAAYYFGLVASALPSLHDGNGWTAAERYYASLVHIGDRLADAGEWCSAQEQYEVALAYSSSSEVQSLLDHAALECSPPTETPEPETVTPTFTYTPSPTLILPGSETPTPTTAVTTEVSPTPTVEQTIPPGPSETPSPTVEFSPTPPTPSDTPAPTVEPSPTEPIPTPSETLPPSDTPAAPLPTSSSTTELQPSDTVEATPTPPPG
jgi:tetratricopeptide (TPR) repeat protein